MSDQPHRVVVEPEEAGQTLAAIVRAAVPETSWNKARALVRSGRASLDGVTTFDPALRVRAEAVVEVNPTGQKRKFLPLDPSCIVHSDHDVVVVLKPAGVVSVPYEPGEPGSLIEQVQHALHQKTPLGVVQRLDKDTTGVMVFARTRVARKHLEKQFRARSILRSYLALAIGEAEETTHTSHLMPDRGDGRRGSWRGGGRVPRSARESITHVEVRERFTDATLVACRLETGRQHQIRIHLSEAGTPLIGERVYARKGVIGPRASRPLLHAASLGFRHPANDRPMHFEDEPPADFQTVLEQLRSNSKPV